MPVSLHQLFLSGISVGLTPFRQLRTAECRACLVLALQTGPDQSVNRCTDTAEPYAPYPFAAKPQLDWLEADLKAANANRAAVPWILLTSHYPLYCSTCANIARANVSAASWVGPEFGGGAGALTAAKPGDQTAGAMQATMLADLEPLMLKYGVDVYAAGHQHQYESMYPVKHGVPTAKHFENPRAPTHFLTGNVSARLELNSWFDRSFLKDMLCLCAQGGPPGIDLFGVDPARGPVCSFNS
jgi:hypothetical protein